MNQVLKQGMSGYLVEVLQLRLDVPVNSIFDGFLTNEVKNFQTKHKLKPDGIVGYLTWDALDLNPEEIYADTDINSSASWITQYLLPEGEYVKQPTSKKWIVLHSNHGLNDPYKQIDTWAKDQRGRVGSNYVIGGLNPADDYQIEGDKLDGQILQSIKDLYWGYHLGPVKNPRLQSNSISIELCSAGPLEIRDGKYFTWFNLEVNPTQVVTLSEPFKGHTYFHAYSKKQIDSLKALLMLLKERHNIDLTSGLIKSLRDIKGTSRSISISSESAFNYNVKNGASNESGLFTHGNLNESKLDLFPQAELIEMLKEIR